MQFAARYTRLNLVFTGLGLLFIAALLWYSNSLVQRLARDEIQRLELHRAINEFIATHDVAESEFLFNNVVRDNARFSLLLGPIIMTDDKGNPVSDANLGLPPNLDPKQRDAEVRKLLAVMKQAADLPVQQVEYEQGRFFYLYYSESDVLRQLRYFPYVMLLVLAVVIAAAFMNLYVSQRDNQNRVWAGLAKETAHQLGTPISGLMAWVELLRMKATEAGDADNQELANEIQRDVERLQHVAERFSKIGSTPELVYYPLNKIVEHAADYVRSRASRSANIEMVVEKNLHDYFEVPINPMLFEWVLENLLKNAIDALAGMTGGRVTIRTDRKGAWVVLEVEDTGKGIARSDIRQVFRPGFTTKKRGWGLGLSLSRRIIENYHNGKIFVRRSEPGRGTTFRILLPAIHSGLNKAIEVAAHEAALATQPQHSA